MTLPPEPPAILPYKSNKQRLNDWNSKWRMWEKPATYHRTRNALYTLLADLIDIDLTQYPSSKDMCDDIRYAVNMALMALEEDA